MDQIDLLLNNWSNLKRIIYKRNTRPFFRPRDVWWTSIGFNIGDETYGKNDNFERPVLILKKFNNNIFLGAPLSSKTKVNKYFTSVSLRGGNRSVMISQIRIFDAKRIIRKIGYISERDFTNVLNNIVDLLK